MKNNGNHFHIVVWAAEGRTEVGYVGVTYVDVIVKSPEEAIERAKQLAPGRNFYHVNNIIEHHPHAEREG